MGRLAGDRTGFHAADATVAAVAAARSAAAGHDVSCDRTLVTATRAAGVEQAAGRRDRGGPHSHCRGTETAGCPEPRGREDAAGGDRPNPEGGRGARRRRIMGSDRCTAREGRGQPVAETGCGEVGRGEPDAVRGGGTNRANGDVNTDAQVAELTKALENLAKHGLLA